MARSTRRPRAAERVSRLVLLLAAGTSLLVVILVGVFLAVRALPVLTSIGLPTFFLSSHWDPDAGIGFGGAGSFGALTPIAGSVLVVGLALTLAIPLALAVAILIAEVNPVTGTRYIRPAIETLVGIPSVVYGYAGFLLLLPVFRHLAPPGDDGSGYLAAGVILAIMVMPTIATLSADALKALPPTLKEGSLALGATQWQTIRRVQLPAARGGIVSGVVLGLARAMGEALAVALVIGDVNRLPDLAHHGLQGLIQPGTTMTVTITDGVNNLAINPEGTAARYALAVILMLIVFGSITVVRRMNRGTTVPVL